MLYYNRVLKNVILLDTTGYFYRALSIAKYFNLKRPVKIRKK